MLTAPTIAWVLLIGLAIVRPPVARAEEGIGGAARNLGHAVRDAGKAIGKGAKQLGRQSKGPAREVGHGFRDGAIAVGHGFRDGFGKGVLDEDSTKASSSFAPKFTFRKQIKIVAEPEQPLDRTILDLSDLPKGKLVAARVAAQVDTAELEGRALLQVTDVGLLG